MRGRAIGFVGALAIVAAMPQGAAWSQETREVRVARGFGIPYLPVTVMIERELITKNARAAGLGEVKGSYIQLASGAAMTDALLSGNLDLATGGPGPLVTVWARSKGNLNIKGVSAISSIPIYLNTTNPNIKTLKDFSDNDRIAVPTVKVSTQAVTLQIAAEQLFGRGKHDMLDKLTVSVAPPDAHNAMMSRGTEITANFTSPPFSKMQIDSGKATRVLNSYEVMDGPANFILMWTTTKWREQNPRTYKVVLQSIEEANQLIKDDPKGIAELWMKAENSKLDRAFVEGMVRDPENIFSTTPQAVMKYADFMHRIGSVKERPAAWQDMFFPEIHAKPGT
jgi:NitT/TauT family transport system substrate-binding protein